MRAWPGSPGMGCVSSPADGSGGSVRGSRGPTVDVGGGDFAEGAGLLACGTGPVVSLVSVATGREVARLEDPNQDVATFPQLHPRRYPALHDRQPERVDPRLGPPADPPPTRRAGPRLGGPVLPAGSPPARSAAAAPRDRLRLDGAVSGRPATIADPLQRCPHLPPARRRGAPSPRPRPDPPGPLGPGAGRCQGRRRAAPRDRRAWFLIGWIQLELGRLDEAVASLRQAIDCPRGPGDHPVELADATSLLNEAARLMCHRPGAAP